MKAFIAFLVSAFAATAYSYPENVRHGYLSCTSCHVAPGGGGTLTPYGRGAAEAFLSTYSKDGEAQPGYGAIGELPDRIMVGGDQRGVGVATYASNGAWARVYVPMQNDVELAIKLTPQVTADASVGVYGPEHAVEYRRTYLKIDLSPTLSIRGGRFVAAYGLNLPDHTTVTREQLGLGEGGETYNAEVAWIVPGGESILTFIYGDHANFSADPKAGYDNQAGSEMSGAAWRNALYLTNTVQLGVSYLGVSNFETWRQAYGTFLQAGITEKGYVLAEYDRKFETGETHDLGTVKLGWELLQGVMGTVQGDFYDHVKEGRVGLQWWPRPHWELLGEVRRTWPGVGYVDTGLLMVHHYL